MEEDIDIYEDLPNFAVERNGNPGGFKEEDTSRVHKELNKRISELTTELEQFRKVNQNLVVNLTSLLKTAKAEISRKDKIIETLRKELDDMKFRRAARSRCGPRVAEKATTQKESIPAVLQVPSDTQSLEIDSTACDAEMDSCYEYSTKHGPKQNTANNVSNTLFSERLCKRIANSEHVEKTTGRIDSFNNDSNSCGSAQGYVQESDKENSSRSNVPTARSHSHTINKLDSIVPDLQKSSLPNKCSTKRTNEETMGSTASKRFKVARKEDDTFKPKQESPESMNNRQLRTSKWQEHEGHAHHLNKKYSSKYVDAKYAQDAYDKCTYQHPNESSKRYDRKGARERSSYRHSVDSGFQKKEKRWRNEERHEKRSEDYRARRRSPFNTPYQDDRSDRNKYDKHTNRRDKYDKNLRNDKDLHDAYKATNRRDSNNRRSSCCASDSKYSSRWRSPSDSLETRRRESSSRDITFEKKLSSYSSSLWRSQSREKPVEDTGSSIVGELSPERDNLQIVLDETDSEFTKDCGRNSLKPIDYEDGEVIDTPEISSGNLKPETPGEPPTTGKLTCPRKLTNSSSISENMNNPRTLVNDLKSEPKVEIENNESLSTLDEQAYHVLANTSFSKEECVENIEQFIRDFVTVPAKIEIKSAHGHGPTQDGVHSLENFSNQYDVKEANNTEKFGVAKSKLSSVVDSKELILLPNRSNQFETLDASVPCDHQETPRIVTKAPIINIGIQGLKTDRTTIETQKDTETESSRIDNIANVVSILTDEKLRTSDYLNISKEIPVTGSEEVEVTEEPKEKSSSKNCPCNNSESRESNLTTDIVAASSAPEKNLELQVKCKNQAHSRAQSPPTNIINRPNGVHSTIGDSQNTHRKSAATGKLVIFARRKNPVRLVDKNANMTTADPSSTISFSTASKLKTANVSNSDGNTDFCKLSGLRKIES